MTLDLGLLVKSPKKAVALAQKCVEFVAALTSSRGLHFQLLRLGPSEDKAIQTMYLRVCQQLLVVMRDSPEQNHDLLCALDQSLGNIQGLLSVSGFVAVSQELLQDEDTRVRQRALDLLENRLLAMKRDGGISRDEAALFGKLPFFSSLEMKSSY